LSFKGKFTRISLLFINKDTCTLFPPSTILHVRHVAIKTPYAYIDPSSGLLLSFDIQFLLYVYTVHVY
jgi:hypothetical protein